VLQTLAVCAIAGGQSATGRDRTAPAVALSARREASDALDFWIGRWDVVAADGRRIGTTVIEKILGGRAVLEQWRGIGGDERKRLYIYKPATGQWTEVAVMEPGGWREKILVESAPGTVRFQGELTIRGGKILLDRTTFVPLAPHRVQQIVDRSRDGGLTWQPASTSVYLKRGGDI
jgi:hypothetical protein